MGYIQTRPVELLTTPGRRKETFSTPHCWRIVSEALRAADAGISTKDVVMLASGWLSQSHARSFAACVDLLHGSIGADTTLSGRQDLPTAPEQRDLLFFVVQAIRARLAKEPQAKGAGIRPPHRILVKHARRAPAAQWEASMAMAGANGAIGSGDGAQDPLAWFVIEIMRDLPGLALQLSVKR